MKEIFFAKTDISKLKMSKGHKKLIQYITDNYDKAAFMTASKLGETVGVSESTVVRFAHLIGFKGYPELQKELQRMVKSKLTSVQQMESSDKNDLVKLMNADINLIRDTVESVSQDDFNSTVFALNNAKRIYILGAGSSAVLAGFLHLYLNRVFENVVLIETTGEGEMFEQMFRIGKDDVCIAFSFPRYSNQTINALRFAGARGAKTAAITDSAESPIAKLADILLVAKIGAVSVVDSLVAPLSLINALASAVNFSRADEAYNNFNELERIWDEYQVYDV